MKTNSFSRTKGTFLSNNFLNNSFKSTLSKALEKSSKQTKTVACGMLWHVAWHVVACYGMVCCGMLWHVVNIDKILVPPEKCGMEQGFCRYLQHGTTSCHNMPQHHATKCHNNMPQNATSCHNNMLEHATTTYHNMPQHATTTCHNMPQHHLSIYLYKALCLSVCLCVCVSWCYFFQNPNL